MCKVISYNVFSLSMTSPFDSLSGFYLNIKVFKDILLLCLVMIYKLIIYSIYSCVKLTLVSYQIFIRKNLNSKFLLALNLAKEAVGMVVKTTKVFGLVAKTACSRFTRSINRISVV